jgi:hypothetical protein
LGLEPRIQRSKYTAITMIHQKAVKLVIG